MIIYITGVSRGLGLALAENYLNNGKKVVGIGRIHSIQHQNFTFIKCDLSQNDQVENLAIDIPKNEEIILINNAGILGEIKRVSDQDFNQSTEVFQINTIAPIQLIRKFSRLCAASNSKLTILNISSGAGRRAIPSWATYCASKAALDLFSETFQLEELEKGSATKIFSLAPGVLDTEMQEHIRKTSFNNFSSLEKFTNLFNEKELKSPEKIANQIRLTLKKNLFLKVLAVLD